MIEAMKKANNVIKSFQDAVDYVKASEIESGKPGCRLIVAVDDQVFSFDAQLAGDNQLVVDGEVVLQDFAGTAFEQVLFESRLYMAA